MVARIRALCAFKEIDLSATLLHIEDSDVDRAILIDFLTDPTIDIRIESVATMAAGLEALRQHTVDLVLSDLSLPDSFGKETFMRLREEAPNVPIVLLTDRNDEEFAVQLISLGAQDYLQKGDLNRETLLRALRYAVERKRIDKELKTAEARFRAVVEAAPNAMVMVDVNGHIALINSQTEKLFGYDREELLGQPLEMLVPMRFRSQHSENRRDFQKAPTSRAMGSGRDLYGVRVDGKEVPIEIGLNPMVSAEGNFVLACIIDITERKLSEDNMRRALNEKSAMLQEIHHRVKNNLQIISSLLSMQASALSDRNVVEKLLESQERVKTMALIHEHLYRHEDMSSIDLSEYIRDLAAQLFSSYRHSSSITCHLDVVPTRLSIEQSVPFGLILNELITNAIKYAYPEGKGEITVRLSTAEDLISISVTDAGVGLPATYRQGSSKSFGMTLVEALTSQLDGELAIGGPPGVSFTVRFKSATPTS